MSCPTTLSTQTRARTVGLLRWAADRIRPGTSPGSIADTEPGHWPHLVDLAPIWSTKPRSSALSEFLQTFEGSLATLRLRLVQRLGTEIVESLPLHQQIGFAEELGIWEDGDVGTWRECLSVRTRVLSQGGVLPLTALNRHTLWLKKLNQRTALVLSN